MNKDVNKNNRYLAKSIGVEVESCRPMMEGIANSLARFFPSGNSESDKIYELQTVPIMTNKPLDVLLLGEITRRCIPNFVVGGGDIASASAHCHAVGFPYVLEEEHVEALMVGLMPFLSISWCRNDLNKYFFRASVTGTGGSSRYARFLNKELAPEGYYNYAERRTWIKNQTSRHLAPSAEIRANENSPLWIYFITPMLTNQAMVDKLRELGASAEFKKIHKKVYTEANGSLGIYNNFIIKVVDIIVPFLLERLPEIVSTMPKNQQGFMTEVLTAYLLENEKEYDTLVNTLISGDEEVEQFFKVLETSTSKHISTFNVLKKETK